MAEETLLSDDFLRQLMNVGEVDVLVAIPTHNQAKDIATVVQTVRMGLIKHFPRERAVLVNADSGSRDGSSELAQAAAEAPLPAQPGLSSLRTFHAVTARWGNGTGAGSPLRLVLAAADLLQAKACALLPPSPSITPETVERLLQPVYRKNYDFVAPLYQRHKFDGLLVKLLIYPMVRAMYGKRIREPFAAEAGLSGRLGSDLLASEEFWKVAGGQMGEEVLVSVAAAAGGYRICEAFVGPRTHSEEGGDLVSALRQSVGVLFEALDRRPARWQSVTGSEAVPVEGGDATITTEPLRVNRKRLYQMFHSGVADLQPVLQTILTPRTLADLSQCANLPEHVACFPDELWARAVYEFAASYHKSVISRDHILQALAPLYRGKVFHFLVENRDATGDEVRQRVEGLGAEFEIQKPHLRELWEANVGGAP